MKKTLFKRAVCAGVAAALMLSLGGCGKTNSPELASKENLYSAKEISLDGYDSVNAMTASGDRIYIVGSKTIEVKNSTATGENSDSGVMAKEAFGGMLVEEISTETAVSDTAESETANEADTEASEGVAEEMPAEEDYYVSDMQYYQQYMLAALDYDGNKVAEKVIYDGQEKGSNVWMNINSLFMSGENVCILANENSWNDVTGESKETFYIERFDPELGAVGRVELDSLKENYDSDNYFYISNYIEDKEGNGYVQVDNGIMVLDANGKFLFTLKMEDNASQNSGSYISNVICGKNGTVYVFINSYTITDDNYETKTVAKTVDLAKKGFGDVEYPVSLSAYGAMSSAGDMYDLIYNGDTTLYGYNIETDEKTTIIDWIKSGIDTTALETTIVSPDGRIIYSSHNYEINPSGGYSYSNGDLIINILTKIDPSEVPDKELITMSTMYIPYNIKSKISEFNKNSDKYQIEVTSYLDNDWSNYDDCLKRFNNDLVAGNIPDLLVVDASLPFNSYVSKGLIADLGPIMEKDETFNREDYLENVLEALSIGGKLYRIAPSFSIQTMAAKKSIVGDKQSWTIDDFLAVHEANPNSEMIMELTNSNFVNVMIVYNMNQFVNAETGECSFNSDSFKKILEYANTLPTEIDYDSLYSDENYWIKREMAYRDDTAILKQEYIYDFRTLKQDEAAYFGEPVTFIGVPSDNGNGSMLQVNTSLSITSKAKNPDGAWEFIKTLLTDEVQDNPDGLPIKTSSFNKLAEKAKERPYWENENGEKEYYDETVWMGEQTITVEPNTDEDNERMINFIKSVKNVYEYDTDLFKIIDEEVQAYFSGQKSVDEVADIIQNRASTYISENR
ncbi:MAG: extracellular solute-binding protein [Oscillospiraceae bacterium]